MDTQNPTINSYELRLFSILYLLKPRSIHSWNFCFSIVMRPIMAIECNEEYFLFCPFKNLVENLWPVTLWRLVLHISFMHKIKKQILWLNSNINLKMRLENWSHIWLSVLWIIFHVINKKAFNRRLFFFAMNKVCCGKSSSNIAK